ncbi:sugar kinase [Marinoscillum pacificum]|uniref:sugar kinase n=1 Tax=Marinoscillum pacificum TaxID=392723 RepID=UPI002157EA9A|nr:sugar kinase [Marinoscillum pacificum]
MSVITCFGEILLRLSTPTNQLFCQSNSLDIHFGGSEANVAVSLAKMNQSARIVSKLPEHDLSDAAITTFKSHGVDTRLITRGSGRFGLYYLEQGASVRGSKVIYDRDGSSFANILREDINWGEVFSGSNWLHLSGISPAVSQSAANVCLEAVKVAKSFGMKVSMDLNFRKNLWNYGKKPHEIMPTILGYVDVLLGDPATFNLMTGTKVPVKNYYQDATELAESYHAIHREYSNLEYIAMTLRDVISADHNVVGGALYHNGEMYSAKKQEVTSIVERIGGGDAFMAGLIYGISNKKSNDFIVNYATAASVLKLTIPGDFSLFNASQIESVMLHKHQGKIER